MPATRPRLLLLSSPRCPHVLSVQPVPWHGRGAWFSCALCSAWDSLHGDTCVLCRLCWQTAPTAPASSVTHAVIGAVAFGCRAGGWDHSAELLQHCQAAANPTQAKSAWVISEQKKTLVLGSPTSAGPPAAQCLTCWGSLCLGISVGTAVVRDGGAGPPGWHADQWHPAVPRCTSCICSVFPTQAARPLGPAPSPRPQLRPEASRPAAAWVAPVLALTLPLLLGPRGAGLHLRLGVRERGPRARQLQL